MSVEFTAVRSTLGSVLRNALGAGWVVYDYAAQLDAITTGVISINRKAITTKSTGEVLNEIEVHVVEPKAQPDLAENALEARLKTVLDALATSGFTPNITGAERAMFPVGTSAAHSYVITLQLISRK